MSTGLVTDPPSETVLSLLPHGPQFSDFMNSAFYTNKSAQSPKLPVTTLLSLPPYFPPPRPLSQWAAGVGISSEARCWPCLATLHAQALDSLALLCTGLVLQTRRSPPVFRPRELLVAPERPFHVSPCLCESPPPTCRISACPFRSSACPFRSSLYQVTHTLCPGFSSSLFSHDHARNRWLSSVHRWPGAHFSVLTKVAFLSLSLEPGRARD